MSRLRLTRLALAATPPPRPHPRLCARRRPIRSGPGPRWHRGKDPAEEPAGTRRGLGTCPRWAGGGPGPPRAKKVAMWPCRHGSEEGGMGYQGRRTGLPIRPNRRGRRGRAETGFRGP